VIDGILDDAVRQPANLHHTISINGAAWQANAAILHLLSTSSVELHLTAVLRCRLELF